MTVRTFEVLTETGRPRPGAVMRLPSVFGDDVYAISLGPGVGQIRTLHSIASVVADLRLELARSMDHKGRARSEANLKWWLQLRREAEQCESTDPQGELGL